MSIEVVKLAGNRYAVEKVTTLLGFTFRKGAYVFRGVNRQLQNLRDVAYASIGDTGYGSWCVFEDEQKACESRDEIKALLGVKD